MNQTAEKPKQSVAVASFWKNSEIVRQNIQTVEAFIEKHGDKFPDGCRLQLDSHRAGLDVFHGSCWQEIAKQLPEAVWKFNRYEYGPNVWWNSVIDGVEICFFTHCPGPACEDPQTLGV